MFILIVYHISLRLSRDFFIFLELFFFRSCEKEKDAFSRTGKALFIQERFVLHRESCFADNIPSVGPEKVGRYAKIPAMASNRLSASIPIVNVRIVCYNDRRNLFG